MLGLFFLLISYDPQTLTIPPFKHTLGFYRASRYYLQLYLGPTYDYEDPQGVVAVKLKELDNPETSKDDDELTVFAVNSGAGHILYNTGLASVKLFGDDEEFSEPKGITANPEGMIVLADFGNRRVVKLQYHRGEIEQVGEIPTPGRPFDVCLDSENNLYVTDFDSSRIYVFSPEDSLILSFGIQGKAYGELYQPMGVAVIDADDQYNFHNDDFIIVTDNYGRRLSKFTRQGRFVGSVYDFELGLAGAYLYYVALDSYGSVYVTDEVNDQIHKFDHNLKYIISVGRTGTGKGEFISPRGITIWRRYGQVFVSEKQGGQYLWLAVDGFVVGCFPKIFSAVRPGTTLAIYLTDEARVYITVLDQRGDKIRDLIEGIRRVAGEYLVVWDGLDSDNKLVPPGDYVFQIRLKGLQGHGRRINKKMQVGVKCIEL